MKKLILASVIGSFFMVGHVAAGNDTIGMRTDTIDLINAIEIASKEANATPMSVKREIERGEQIYNVSLVQNDNKSVNVIINTKTGEAKVFNETDEAEDIRENTLWLAHTKVNQNVNIINTLRNAEKDWEGIAYAISANLDNEQPTFEIDMISHRKDKITPITVTVPTL